MVRENYKGLEKSRRRKLVLENTVRFFYKNVILKYRFKSVRYTYTHLHKRTIVVQRVLRVNTSSYFGTSLFFRFLFSLPDGLFGKVFKGIAAHQNEVRRGIFYIDV